MKVARLSRCLVAALALFAGCLTSLPTAANEYSDVHLRGSRLVGLPPEFNPAELDLKTYRLRIGSHVTTLGEWCQSFFEQPYDLELGGSFVETEFDPPHLHIVIQPKNRPLKYWFDINLETLQLFRVTIRIKFSANDTGLYEVVIPQDADVQHTTVDRGGK